MLFLFLDTETTSLNYQTGQIIELAATLCQFNPDFLENLPDVSNTKADHFIPDSQPKLAAKLFPEIGRLEILVKLRQELDDKTTRITGINQKILQDAPKLELAQQIWQTWLEKELKQTVFLSETDVDTNSEPLDNRKTKLETRKIDFSKQKLAIIGHSLDFDLNFLRHEGWFLPEFETIDTLELSKIFLPEMTAVNLEFLTKQLNLTPANKITSEILPSTENLPKLSNSTPTSQDSEAETGQTFHRALFDAICCQNLLAFLLAKMVYCPVPDSLVSFWVNQLNQFLPNQVLGLLPLNQQLDQKNSESANSDQNLSFKNNSLEKSSAAILPSNNSQTLNLENYNSARNPHNFPINIDFDGQISQSLTEKIQIWSRQVSPVLLAKVLDQPLPRSLSLLVLQLVWLSLSYQKLEAEQQNLDKLTLRLHAQKEYLTMAELLVSDL